MNKDKLLIPCKDWVARRLARGEIKETSAKTEVSVIRCFIQDAKVTEWESLTEADILKGMETSRRRLARNTCARNFRIARAHLRHLAEIAMVEENLPDLINPPSFRQSAPTFITEKEFDRIAQFSGNSRDRAMWEMMFCCGLRNSEVRGLKLGNIGEQRAGSAGDSLHIVRLIGKGDKPRTVPIPPRAYASLQIWLRERAKIKFGLKTDLLFITSSGKQVSDNHVTKSLQRAARHSGYTGRIHPHVLRHSFATHLLNKKVPESYIRDLMGHSSIKMLERYAHVIGPELVTTFREAWR